MDKQYKKYLSILLITQIVIFAVVTSIFIFLSQNITSHNNDILEKVAIKNKEQTMRERVENTIVHIKTQEQIAFTEVKKTIDLAISLLSTSDETNIYQNVQQIFTNIHRLKYGLPVKMILYNDKTSKVEQFSENQESIIVDLIETDGLHAFLKSLYIYDSKTIGNYHIYFFVYKSDIEDIAKKYIYNEISSSKYDEDEYIWINEIINYEGGDHYALRIVHPNLKHTEGTYLSTNTKDIKGNLPYLKELNGVKENGEILQSYYFKNKTDDQITPKISYAKLFKPYNWVIATGEPIDDIFLYTNELKKYDKRMVQKTLSISFGFMSFIFIASISFMLSVHKNYRKNIENYVRTETELDALTGAYSRKIGALKIEELYSQFKENSNSPLLLMIDIDNFKRINDTYGHDIGDIVLKKVSMIIQSNIRNSDYLFRWGGEEFILLCNPIDLNNQHQIAQKILRSVNAISFETDKGFFNISISIGGACFNKNDDHHTQAIKRADLALYQSKNTGKNKYTSSCDSVKGTSI